MSRMLLALGLALLAGGGAAAQNRLITATTVIALQRWVDAVRGHVPGLADDAVEAIWKLTMDDRRDLDPGMQFLLHALRGKGIAVTSAPEKRIAELGGDLLRNPGAKAFLKRAAVLHGDAAMFGYRGPVRTPVPPGVQTPPARSPAAESPLLVDRRMWLENDGQLIGYTESDWNWVFARSLLDRVEAMAPDPFVGEWYHATTAFMFRHRIFGEVAWHLERAAVVLPNDPRVRLDRGCFEEYQGLPRSQSVLSDEDLMALRLHRGQSQGPFPSGLRLSPTAREVGIRPAEVANGEAERQFRRAIERDPRLFEARVRLARLLSLRSKYAEALAVIAAAPDGTSPDGVATYYAHLFAARAERELGRLDAAGDRLEQARRLFPDAQSVLMAASHLAMLRADAAGAEEPMRHLALLPPDRPPSDDPWWVYDTFTGRYADGLLEKMWAGSVSRWRD